MAHVVNGKGKREKQIVTDNDPDDLHLIGRLRHSIEQTAGNGDHHA